MQQSTWCMNWNLLTVAAGHKMSTATQKNKILRNNGKIIIKHFYVNSKNWKNIVNHPSPPFWSHSSKDRFGKGSTGKISKSNFRQIIESLFSITEFHVEYEIRVQSEWKRGLTGSVGFLWWCMLMRGVKCTRMVYGETLALPQRTADVL